MSSTVHSLRVPSVASLQPVASSMLHVSLDILTFFESVSISFKYSTKNSFSGYISKGII